MRTEQIFVIWSCIRIKGKISRDRNWFKPPNYFLTHRSKAVTLHFCFCFCGFICGVCSVLIYVSSRLLLVPRKGSAL